MMLGLALAAIPGNMFYVQPALLRQQLLKG